ncbi:hypothetical protein DM860_001859 [Cuscuta australis]|uniref:RING-type domain-containing protein n=1 Tax=Cuscuta australis TaxID=267555 RepID=A0A328EE52_9ASTE|nr:hypothetical protein DM860_001859 [Cuscuta australis]
MGCNTREKHIRASRKTRSAKPDPELAKSKNASERAAMSKSAMDSGIRPSDCCAGSNCPAKTLMNPNQIPGVDENGWGYCTEEQLEEILLRNLEVLHNEAIVRLISFGYTEDVALKAVLKNGFCYGGMDVLTNIMHNALSYLNSSDSKRSEDSEKNNFTDMKQMLEYSLAGMVCLLQQVKPHLSKGDAMWCLLMSDLHVGRASVMDVPLLSQPNGVSNATPSSACRFHENPNDLNGNFMQKEIECPKRFNLSPSMKNLLKRNVAAFAAGFRSNTKSSQNQTRAGPGMVEEEGGAGKGDESGQDVVLSVLNKFRDLNLEESMDQKEETIVSLVRQAKDLERQVKERKEWAHQKAMQAARKLSNDLTELKLLRMEREETQGVKKGKQVLEDNTMKRLTEMENALRKASGEVDRANSAVKKLENENAEIRAEMEACKLSASESAMTCMEVAKREKKCLKKLSAWEKQKAKLQEDIASEKQKISELVAQLAQVEASKKEAEAKWWQEQKAKEQAMAQVEEERRLKEATEVNNKRKLEALRLKVEIDFQRQKDDLLRLEQELSRLKSSSEQTADTHNNHHNSVTTPGDIARLLQELDNFEKSSAQEKEDNGCDRECIICSKDEVSVVFLPCAHQVLCANCNESYGKKGRATCPSCRVPIEQRVRVFGASS